MGLEGEEKMLLKRIMK